MSTSKFEDHLWREFVRNHGDDLRLPDRPAARQRLRRPQLVAGAGLGLAGGATALALALTAASAPPAFAVTVNHNGTVTVTINGPNGIAGANARLHQLGIRATVAITAPAGCVQNKALGVSLLTPPPGTGSDAQSITAKWTINPASIPAGSSVVLTSPSAGNYIRIVGPSAGDSASSSSSDQHLNLVWTCEAAAKRG